MDMRVMQTIMARVMAVSSLLMSGVLETGQSSCRVPHRLATGE